MAKVKLGSFAFARSGDKGDGSNVGVFVTNQRTTSSSRRS